MSELVIASSETDTNANGAVKQRRVVPARHPDASLRAGASQGFEMYVLVCGRNQVGCHV